MVGTTGVLGAMGAYSAARSLTTVAPLSSSGTVSRGIGQINAGRQEAALAQETSTSLHDANEALGTTVFNSVTAPPPSLGALIGQAPSLTQWHTQQTQIAPAQFLSRARQSHIISVQQYQALARSPAAQAEFAENYKGQLETIAEYDTRGNLTPRSLGQVANLRNSFRNRAGHHGKQQERNASALGEM